MLSLLSSIARNRRRSRARAIIILRGARSLRERSSANELGERMSEKKWTPGPWIVSGVRRWPEPKTKIIAVGPDSGYIAGVYFSDLTPAQFAASHADARLIAAAPDLFDALELIAEGQDVGRHDGLPEDGPVHDAETMFAVARRALAKARGEA